MPLDSANREQLLQRKALLERKKELLAQKSALASRADTEPKQFSVYDRMGEDIARTPGRAGRSMAAGAASILDAPRAITDPLFGLGEMGARAVGADKVADYFKSEYSAPTFSQRTKRTIDEATNNAYAPRNKTEEAVDFAGELTTAFFTPATLTKLGQAGINIFNKSADSIANFFHKGRGNVSPEAQKIVNVLLNEGKTPEQIMEAAKQAKQSPIPTTMFEQAESPKGLALQRSLTEEPSIAGSYLQKFNKERMDASIPEAIQGAAGKGASTTSSYASGQGLQPVAKSIIDDAVKARLSAASGQYTKAQADIIPADKLNIVIKDPVYQSALRQVEKDPGFKRLTQSMPKNSAGYWDYVYRYVRDKSDTLVRGGDKTLGGAYGKAAEDLRGLLDEVSSNLQVGREEFAKRSPEIMRLQKGLVGQIAKMKSPDKIAEAIMRAPKEEISATKKLFLQKDPQAWQDITASYLSHAGDKASSLRTYLSAVDKNAVMRDKTQAMLTPSQYKAHRLLVQNLRRIEAGLPRNSETVSKAQAAAELNGGSADEAVIQGLSQGPTAMMLSTIRAGWRASKAKMNAQYKEGLAKALVSPDLDELGKALAKAKPGSRDAVKIIDDYLTPYIAVAGETAQQKALPAPKKD